MLRDSRPAITEIKERKMVMEMSNENNNLRKRGRNVHYNEDLKEYIMELWMSGTSEHVIDKLVQRRVREVLRERREKNAQKSA